MSDAGPLGEPDANQSQSRINARNVFEANPPAGWAAEIEGAAQYVALGYQRAVGVSTSGEGRTYSTNQGGGGN